VPQPKQVMSVAPLFPCRLLKWLRYGTATVKVVDLVLPNWSVAVTVTAVVPVAGHAESPTVQTTIASLAARLLGSLKFCRSERIETYGFSAELAGSQRAREEASCFRYGCEIHHLVTTPSLAVPAQKETIAPLVSVVMNAALHRDE